MHSPAGLASPLEHARSRRLVGAASAIAVAAAAAVIGCAGSNSGSDRNAAIGGYCSLINDYAEQCSKTDACTQALARNCASYESSLSAAYDSALGVCLAPPYDCGQGGTDAGAGSPNAIDGCLERRLATAMPTDAQAGVRRDFCDTCPDGASPFVPDACSTFFLTDGSSARGTGLSVLLVNDRIAAEVDEQCTGKAARSDPNTPGDCALEFLACSGAVIGASAPEPTACAVGGPSDASLE